MAELPAPMPKIESKATSNALSPKAGGMDFPSGVSTVRKVTERPNSNLRFGSHLNVEDGQGSNAIHEISRRRSREAFRPAAYAGDDLGTLQMDQATGVPSVAGTRQLASEPVSFEGQEGDNAGVDFSLLNLIKSKNDEMVEFRKLKNRKLTAADSVDNLRSAADA